MVEAIAHSLHRRGAIGQLHRSGMAGGRNGARRQLVENFVDFDDLWVLQRRPKNDCAELAE
jgi:hypothetical protein